ncbi:hypothetical protein Tco_1084404 [Tanacetum coccineum]
MGDENHIRTLGDYSKPSHEGYRNTIELPVGKPTVGTSLNPTTLWLVQNGAHSTDFGLLSLPKKVPSSWPRTLLQVQIFYDHVNPVTRRTINQSADGKLCDLNAEESWALLEDLALYDNESWNDPKGFAKTVKAIGIAQGLSEYIRTPLIGIKIKSSLMEASSFAPTQLLKGTKSNNHPRSHDEAGGKWYTFKPEQKTILVTPTIRHGEVTQTLGGDNPKTLKIIFIASPPPPHTCSPTHNWHLIPTPDQPHTTHPINAPILTHSSKARAGLGINFMASQDVRLSKFEADFKRQQEDDGEVMFIEIIRDDDEPQNECPNEGEGATMEGPMIIRRKLDPKENANGGVSNFTGRIKGMHVFVVNFTYIMDFMIIEDISSIIDPRMSHVVLGKPFVEISNMTHDPQEGVVRFTNGNDEVAYKMPHKIEQYNSLSNLEKEHTKSVYLMNEEDKRRGVEYVMSKILGFYKECLELGPEYLTGMDDEGETTLNLMSKSLEILRKFHWMTLG